MENDSGFVVTTELGHEVKFRSYENSDVTMVDIFGDDETPYFAARLSYDKTGELPDIRRLEDFILNLLKKGHLVPFEHCVVTFTLKAPIFVFRQLFRYRTATISEKSMRYTASSDEFFIPNEIYGEEKLRSNYVDTILRTVDTYHRLIECGIRKEQARMVIPTSIFSHAYFTINLRNLFHLLDQRLDPHAQAEIRFIAKRMFDCAKERFPICVQCYKGLHPALFEERAKDENK